jgi:hypothetical protein
MKITQVEYSKTFNLGNYQSAKIGFVAQVDDTDPNESHVIVLDKLKNMVEAAGDLLPRKG